MAVAAAAAALLFTLVLAAVGGCNKGVLSAASSFINSIQLDPNLLLEWSNVPCNGTTYLILCSRSVVANQILRC